MTALLTIDASRYTLAHCRDGKWDALATLPQGAGALLPAGRADEAGLEAAIEIAEDWLMPHARALGGGELAVVDGTGRLAAGLDGLLSLSSRVWTHQEVEDLFLRLVDLSTGSRAGLVAGHHAFIADVLLVRELVHHARLATVRLLDRPPQPSSTATGW